MYKLRLSWLLIVLLSLSSGVKCANAQGLDIKSSSILKGNCNAELAGVALGCDAFVNTSFNNGRTLYNFATQEIASIGFAGSNKETSPTGSILWVDRVYINQAATAADGQCSISQTKQDGDKSEVECRAILRDGRKVRGAMTSLRPASVIVEDKSAINCRQTLKTHAFLSRAQFQCGFRYYSNEMLASASSCSKQLNLTETEMQKIMMPGMEIFDRNEKERGHKKVCQDILRDFPKILRR